MAAASGGAGGDFFGAALFSRGDVSAAATSCAIRPEACNADDNCDSRPSTRCWFASSLSRRAAIATGVSKFSCEKVGAASAALDAGELCLADCAAAAFARVPFLAFGGEDFGGIV